MLISGLTSCVSFKNQEESESKRLNIFMDPRIELFGTIKILSDFKANSNNCATLNTVYKMNTIRYFEPFKDDESVSLYRDMIKASFNDLHFINLLLHLSNPPELNIEMPLNDIQLPKGFAYDSLNKFLESMREFAKKSKFMDFFDSQKDLIKGFVDSQAKSIQNTPQIISDVEDFFGMEQNSYNLIITPLILYEKYFYSFSSKTLNKMDIYLINGISEIRNGYPYFCTEKELKEILYSRAPLLFVFPITLEYEKEIEKYSSLFEPIADKMKRQNIFTWIDCFNEHIVRAIELQLDNLSEDEAYKEIKKAYSSGFIYLKPIFEEIKIYSLNREKYKDFRSFYPRIISLLDNL